MTCCAYNIETPPANWEMEKNCFLELQSKAMGMRWSKISFQSKMVSGHLRHSINYDEFCALCHLFLAYWMKKLLSIFNLIYIHV